MLRMLCKGFGYILASEVGETYAIKIEAGDLGC